MIHEGGHYRLYIENPIWPDRSAPKAQAIQTLTERWSRIVERFIRRFPDQWVWMHDRWKTKAAPQAERVELRFDPALQFERAG
jgi:KDO2-lipid IV(A) lauroyltransferase